MHNIRRTQSTLPPREKEADNSLSPSSSATENSNSTATCGIITSTKETNDGNSEGESGRKRETKWGEPRRKRRRKDAKRREEQRLCTESRSNATQLKGGQQIIKKKPSYEADRRG
jgi:hypothetical protein